MRIAIIVLLSLCARLAAAQTADTIARTTGATVSGVVTDSLDHAPLDGAVVQLVAADGSAHGGRSAMSDSLGRFVIPDVPTGRYTLGFFHPMLDSLGVESPLREVVVTGDGVVHVELAIPSARRLRAAICGEGQEIDSGAVVVGVARKARDAAPAAGASVSGTWLEYTISSQGIVHRRPRLVATTGENGWFAICNVPKGGMMTLQASLGADSTDRLEVQVPAEGFLRRDLYLGSARSVVVAEAVPRRAAADSSAPPAARQHVGLGQLRGTVIAAKGSAPLAGAQVGIVDGPQTRSNDRGEWTLEELPAGTRMLQVRAVGYYPEQLVVDVVAGAPLVRVALSTLKSVLDTIRVTARVYSRDGNGFEQRRRTGMGRYMSPQDIARRGSVFTSQLFRMEQGMRVERDSFGRPTLRMRGAFGWCEPEIYLDGHHIPGITTDDIDGWVAPEKITGIEIYDESMVPAQFNRGMTGCGAILIWSR